jgi:cytoskeletal protein CcmA (bactofilin family)
MFGRRKAPRLPGRIDTLVGRGTVVRGELEFTGGLHVDGVQVGDVRGIEGAAPSALWVGEPGQVKGNIEVAIAVINGEVLGDVRAAQRVVLGAKARVTGDVTYGIIEMTLGARVDGRLVPLSGAAVDSRATTESRAAAESRVPALPAAEPLRADNVVRPFDLRQGRN